MSEAPTRLFGQEYDEYLDADLETAVEKWADYQDGDATGVICEWTVHEPIDHFPTPNWMAEQVAEMLDEWACNNGMFSDDPEIDTKNPKALELLQAGAQALADTVRWRQAKDIVARHPVEVRGLDVYCDGALMLSFPPPAGVSQ